MEVSEMNNTMHKFLFEKQYSCNWDYSNDYNLLMRVWVKFRDLNIENNAEYSDKKKFLAHLLAFHKISDFHRWLYDAITWYNQLNK